MLCLEYRNVTRRENSRFVSKEDYLIFIAVIYLYWYIICNFHKKIYFKIKH